MHIIVLLFFNYGTLTSAKVDTGLVKNTKFYEALAEFQNILPKRRSNKLTEVAERNNSFSILKGYC